MKTKPSTLNNPFRKLCPYCGLYVTNPKIYFELISKSIKTGEVIKKVEICRNCLEQDLHGILSPLLPQLEDKCKH